HSRNNRFIGRYAYLVQPIGRSLDLNFLHNSAKTSLALNQNGFRRNQGVGTWEINLAGFLADLNTNEWGAYAYTPDVLSPSGNLAFDDATALLTHRYQGDYRTLLTASQLFSNSIALKFDLIDSFATGPIIPGGGRPAIDADNPNGYWPGSDSTNHF